MQKVIAQAKRGRSKSMVINHRPGNVVEIHKTPKPDIKGTVTRIVTECDPIGFLMDVVNGNPIETHYISEDGEITTGHEHASLKQRIEAAKYLADKYMPKVAVVKHAHLVLDETRKDNAFDQIVNNAASRASERESTSDNGSPEEGI